MCSFRTPLLQNLGRFLVKKPMGRVLDDVSQVFRLRFACFLRVNLTNLFHYDSRDSYTTVRLEGCATYMESADHPAIPGDT